MAQQEYDLHYHGESLPIGDAEAPAGDLGTLIQVKNWLANQIKAIKGTASWRSAPPITLQAAKEHADAAAPHTGYYAKAQGDARYLLVTEKGAVNGLAGLGPDGKHLNSQTNSLAISRQFEVASQSAMLALDPAVVDPGDLAIRTDFEPDRVFMLVGEDTSVLANWVRVTFGDVVSVNDQTGVVKLAAADVGAAPASHVGSRDGHPLATQVERGFLDPADKTKLDGLGTGGAATDNSKLTESDFLGDYVVSGLLPAVPAPASLSVGIPAGAAYAGGTRVQKGAEAARAYAASRDTYVDLSAGGVYAYSEVANGAAAPALAANSIRLFRVVAGASAVTSIVDLRVLKPPTRAHDHAAADLPAATQSQSGTLSAADKTKLDGVSPNARELNMVPGTGTLIFNNVGFAAGGSVVSGDVRGLANIPVDAKGILWQLSGGADGTTMFPDSADAANQATNGVRYGKHSGSFHSPMFFTPLGTGANAGKVKLSSSAAQSGLYGFVYGYWR